MPKRAQSLPVEDLGAALARVSGVRAREDEFAYRRMLTALIGHLGDGDTLAAVAKRNGVSARVVSYWVSKYKAGGLPALSPKPRGKRPTLSPEDLFALCEQFPTGAPSVETVRAWLCARLSQSVPTGTARHWRLRLLASNGVAPIRRQPRARKVAGLLTP